MAWTDQCRVAFEVSCEGLLAKQEGIRKNLSKVFKVLSSQSGIPQKTLSRWWYEKQKEKEQFEEQLLKIEQGGQEIEEIKKTEKKPSPLPLCNVCKSNNVGVDKRMGRPLGPRAKHYGLCNTCKDRRVRAAKESQCVCGHCGHKHQKKGVER